MAVGAGVAVDQHWAVGRMADCHTGRVIKYDVERVLTGSPMIDWDVRGWGPFVAVTGQAVHRSVVGVHDDVPDRDTCGCLRVGIAG